MKTNLLKRIVFTMLLFSMLNCSIEPVEQPNVSLNSNESFPSIDETSSCGGSEPRARIVNNGTVAFDLEIFDTSGNFLNSIMDVLPTHTSDWVTFGEAETLFSISNSVTTDEKVIFFMENCTQLSIEIDADNKWIYSEPTPIYN